MSLLPWRPRIDFIIDVMLGVFFGGLLVKIVWWIWLDKVIP